MGGHGEGVGLHWPGGLSWEVWLWGNAVLGVTRDTPGHATASSAEGGVTSILFPLTALPHPRPPVQLWCHWEDWGGVERHWELVGYTGIGLCAMVASSWSPGSHSGEGMRLHWEALVHTGKVWALLGATVEEITEKMGGKV